MIPNNSASQDSAFKVGLFVDGFTLRKVNEFYRGTSPMCSGINMQGLKHWVAVQASRFFWPGRQLEMMCHYYHPFRNPDADSFSHHIGMIGFSNELARAGFEIHYAEVDFAHSLCPNLDLKNDALLFAEYHQLNALVLVSTQGQYADLPLKLGERNIPTLLLGWNFVYHNQEREIHWHTDKNLRRNSTYYIPMENIMNKASTDVLAQEIFLLPKERIRAYRGASSGFQRGMST